MNGDYYINMVTGTIQQQHDSTLAAALLAAGFVGPFNTIAEAKAAFNAGKGAVISGLTGGLGSATGALPSVSSISSSILGPLFQANIWIRVGQVLLGLALIAVGVARLTNAVPIATKVATVAAKGAAL